MAVSLRPARATRRIATVITTLAAVFTAACAGEKPVAPVLPENPVVTQFKPLSFVADVDTRLRTVKITAPSAGTANSAPTLSLDGVEGPVLSLLGGEAVRIVPIAGTYTASLSGAFEPNRVRVTFDVLIENKLPGISFITPTWPVAPAAGVVLFPLDYVVTTTTGGVAGGDGNEVVVELPSRGQVTPSIQWDGTPYSFFNDANCSLAVSNDCFRWQAFDATILPLSTSRVETIGFDMDATVGQFRVRMIAAADLAPAGPITPGTVQGVVSSAIRGLLNNVTVTVVGQGSDATDAAGAYAVTGVNPGSRTASVSNLPVGCSSVADQAVSVTSGGTTTANFSVSCTGLPGIIGGIVTRDYDGAPLANVTVTASTGGSDVTDAAGAYSIAGVASGTGSLSIGAVAGETCSALAPVAYNLLSSGTLTSDITVDCQAPLPPGYQYNTTWTALAGNQVQLDIRMDMRTFNRADIADVTTAGALGGTGDPIIGFQASIAYDATKLDYVEEQTILMGPPRLSGAPTVNGSTAGTVQLAATNTVLQSGNVGIIRIIFNRRAGATGLVGTTSTITVATSRTGGANLTVLPNVVNTEATFLLP